MLASEAIDSIQKELNQIKVASDLDEWIMDHIFKIQWIINDFRNQEFKDSEPDPFN